MEDDAAQPLVGELDALCSSEEIRLRTETRQIDKFELPPAMALKKYQRSSADKKYLASEVRSASACWRSVEYLISTVLDFDLAAPHKPAGFSPSCASASFFDIYSFMRDRLRAVRVDLHVQNLLSDPIFVKVHEICLRFELLALFLLWGTNFGESQDRKFDLHLSLTALSQTIDPLTNAYLVAASENIEEITKYVLLLSLTSRGGAKTFKGHYLSQSKQVRESAPVRFAFDTVMHYFSEDYSCFLKNFARADFLAACAMLPVVNTARTRLLWTIVRTNRPFFFRKDSATLLPPPRPEKIPLTHLADLLAFGTDLDACTQFLAFHGLPVTADNVCWLPPRQLTKNPVTWWTSSAEWREKTNDVRVFPEFHWEHALEEAFHKRLGEDVGDSAPPSSCEFEKRIESTLVQKYINLSLSRAQIVSGSATPLARVEAPLAPAPVSPVLPPPPPKPARPPVPLQPLIIAPNPPAAQEPLKRFRESPEKTASTPSPPPTNMSLANTEVKPPQKRRVPVHVPAVQSGFDILADVLGDLVISGPPAMLPPIPEPQDTAREDEMEILRTRFVALKCFRAWSSYSREKTRWRQLLGDKSPLKLN